MSRLNQPGSARLTSDELWRRVKQNNLTLDQTACLLELEAEEVERFYRPLGEGLLEQLRTNRRVMAVVAGPPGSGKSAFAVTLGAVIDGLADEDISAIIGLDGWHYPNEYLDSHFIVQGGRTIPLRAVKGAPETFDLAGARACLERIRSGGEASYPVYSRAIHDPLPLCGQVTEKQRVVLVEGNYWLLDLPAWREMRALFDLRIFLTADAETLLAGLRERHQRGGKSAKAAARQVESVDMPNAALVLNHSTGAQVVVHKVDSRRISRVEFVTGVF